MKIEPLSKSTRAKTTVKCCLKYKSSFRKSRPRYKLDE